MPLVEIKMLQGRTEEQKRELVSEITEVMERVAGAKKESITVLIWEAPATNWAVSGELLTDKAR